MKGGNSPRVFSGNEIKMSEGMELLIPHLYKVLQNDIRLHKKNNIFEGFYILFFNAFHKPEIAFLPFLFHSNEILITADQPLQYAASKILSLVLVILPF